MKDPDVFGRSGHYRKRAVEIADRISRGESWASVAESYGVADVKGFRRRVKRHVGEIGRRNFALDAIEEIQATLDEVRKKYTDS